MFNLSHSHPPRPLKYSPLMQVRATIRSSLDLGADLGTATLDLPRLRAVDVVRRNPVGIVGGGGRHSRAGGLLGRASRLALGGALAVVGLAALALLGEVGSDPDSVEEVHDTSKTGQEEEVEEDAIVPIVSSLSHVD